MKLLTITTALEQLHDGQTTSTALVENCLDKITQLDHKLNAFICVTANEAREAAHQADRDRRAGNAKGLLHGIPLSIKDLIDVSGLATTAGSKVRIDHLAKKSAIVTERLRAAGTILIGKCNLHEFALGTTGEDSAFGITINPFAEHHSAGGSSGGSAASVAAGMALASIGTDTGGSIRIPAAACGVVGLKPSFGELSCQGVVPLSPSLDHIGPLGLTVDDVALVYRAMLSEQVNANTQTQTLGPPNIEDPIRIGLPSDYFLELIDPEVSEKFSDALEHLRNASWLINKTTIPHAADIPETYKNIQLYEAFHTHAELLTRRSADFTSGVRQRLVLGGTIEASQYKRAQKMRQILRQEVDEALKQNHALILPTLAIPAPVLGTETVTLNSKTLELRSLMLRLTQLFNLTGHPSVSIPCPQKMRHGLPCGVQLVGHQNKTPELLRIASSYEKILRYS